MIEFFPRDMGRWRQTGDYDFTQEITLTPKQKSRSMIFHDQTEFFEYLNKKGIRFDDPEFPVELTAAEPSHPLAPCKIVKQWTVQGWIKEHYR